MQKPVNSEIDLIRAIYTRSNDLLLEAKAKKLTPKPPEEPNLFSGVPAPAPVSALAATKGKPKPTTKGKSKSSAKAKPAVSKPKTETTSERVNIDPMTKKEGNAVFAKPKASVSSPISSIPTPTFGSSADIINPGIRINPKRLSSVLTASDIVNRQQPVGSTISTAATKYGDLNNDGMVSKAETELVPALPSAPVAAPVAASTPSKAYNFGQGLRNLKNNLTRPEAIAGFLGAGILAAGILSRNVGMPQQTSANKPTTSITTQSDTFESPPDDVGARRRTPFIAYPVNEQQEITEYYRQVLAQKLYENEETDRNFDIGKYREFQSTPPKEPKKLITGADARAAVPSRKKLVTPKQVTSPVSSNPLDSAPRDGAVTPTEMQVATPATTPMATPSVAAPKQTTSDWLARYMEKTTPDAAQKPREPRVLRAGQKPTATSTAVAFKPATGEIGNASHLYADEAHQASHNHVVDVYQKIALPIMDRLDAAENGRADDPTRRQSHPTLDALSSFKLGIPKTYNSLMSVHPGSDEEKAVTQGHITSLLSATPKVLPTTGTPRGTGTNRSKYVR